jgi:catechol 2,3-dioxygenase-like lactoylglutathione lyase family enzyme
MALLTSHLRVARPTNNIQSLLPFYRDGLGFSVLLTFGEHEGFDGVLLGHPDGSGSGVGYHLEFTKHVTHDAGRAPTEDNLLVFYLPDQKNYEEAVQRMRAAGFEPVPSFNPYWGRCGSTFEDPDGYRVVLANMKVPV